MSICISHYSRINKKGVCKLKNWLRNWQEEYKSKLVTPEKAVSCVKSGDHVVMQHACGEPRTLIEALVKRTDLENVEISHYAAIGPAEYAQPDMKGIFRHNAFFGGGPTRDAINEGRADYTCCYLHESPRALKDFIPVNVEFIHVTPPNKWGYCSLGISVDYTKPVSEFADIIVAQVNEKMPKTYGDTFVHISEMDYIVESTRDLLEIPIPELGSVQKAIGENIAELVNDGDVLQLGFGGIPDATLNALTDKKDLGIHTEMFSDSVIEMVNNGVITGEYKTLHPRKIIASFILGTKELYDFVDDNPMVEFYRIDYVNDPCVIGQIDNLVSINSSIQIDLLGQACSDAIGRKQFTGVGGQVDFVRGAARSKGGKSVLAQPATAAKGTVSRIVDTLDEGALVTTSRYDIQIVVTEYGIADLRYKTDSERAKALINISHPDFREDLRKAAKKRNLIV